MRPMLLALAAAAFTATGAHAQNGKTIFEGKGNCHACHGKDARGTPLAPNLTDSTWINIDGSLDAIRQLVTRGVPKPKQHPAPMPPMGGASLSRAEIEAVALYVMELSRSDDSPAPRR